VPLLSPSVTIEPPRSPPRTTDLHLTVGSSSPLLTNQGDTPSLNSGASSPRPFRIPSRPHTPLLEPRKSLTLPAVQPPEPPPPRRSGELRREASARNSNGPPPHVNRAEKPMISSKQSVRGNNVEPSALTPANRELFEEKASPFNTPPSSGSSPELGPSPGPILGNGPVTTQLQARSLTPVVPFDPPPKHHSLISLRKDQDSDGHDKVMVSPQLTSDLREQRPALPVRPPLSKSTSVSSRNSTQVHKPFRNSSTAIGTLRNTGSGATFPQADDIATSLGPILPKRNISTPTSQLQTPPRPHGRSMTVDQTGDKVSTDFRATGLAQMEDNEPAALLKLPIASTAVAPLSSVDYPDTSLSNRRPPCFKQGPHEIFTRYDTRIFDVCGEYVCTSGSYTRVWSLRDGEQIMSLSHGETIKILSLAFTPAPTPDAEGTRLWLGNNFGELVEVSITLQSPIVATNNTAHNRREIIKIYRHANKLWTLDESGTLHVWGPDSTGIPNLGTPSATFRVPKGHTFSIVVNDELWLATGEDIRVFVPSIDGKRQFQPFQRPLSQPGTGEVTSGALINSQPDIVYFGHTDGKVSIYSTRDYNCVGTVNVSMYKINSLSGVGPYLWAAYNTGMIHIYDTTRLPWAVKKEWRAHVNPVIDLVLDRSSFWKLNRYQVISLGADNILRPWDGLLQEDWLGEYHSALLEASSGRELALMSE
jgi:hypothetical protein